MTDVPLLASDAARPCGLERPRSPLALIAVGLAAFIAASHLEAAVGAFARSAALGLALTGVGAGAALWAVRVARRPRRSDLLIGAGASAALLVLWAWTRTIGLPVGLTGRAPVGALDTLTALDELLLIGFAIAAAGARCRLREAWSVLGSIAISVSFIALAMGCEPPSGSAAPGPNGKGRPAVAALVCHLY